MSNNCYLLRCTDTGDQVLIDAADDAPRLLELIGDGGLTAVVTTHQHWDHHRALAEVVAGDRRHRGRRASPTRTRSPSRPACRSTSGSVRATASPVGTCSLVVIPVAGHTPGSICLVYDDASRHGHPHLFTGDSLFPGGVGNTQGDADRFRQLIDDVSTKPLRRAPRRDLVLPRPRQRLDPRRRAAPRRRVARTRLVTGRGHRGLHPHSRVHRPPASAGDRADFRPVSTTPAPTGRP